MSEERKTLIERAQDWAAERAAIGEAEAADPGCITDQWIGSDDDAVELVRELLAEGLDTASSASRQHYIDTGRYLEANELPPSVAFEVWGIDGAASVTFDGLDLVNVSKVDFGDDEWTAQRVAWWDKYGEAVYARIAAAVTTTCPIHETEG